MPTNQPAQMYTTKGGGDPVALSAADLGWLKGEIQQIVQDGKRGLWGAQIDADDVRLCQWAGQSADGLRHNSEGDGEDVLPFDGSSDVRFRLADMLINEDVMLVVLATLRAIRRVVCANEKSKERKAAKMELALRWMIQNQCGYRFIRELIKLANYTFGDTPGMGFMQVTWRKETQLQMQRVTRQELVAAYVQLVGETLSGLDPQSAQQQVEVAVLQFMDLLDNPAVPADVVAGFLQQMFPHLKPARARKVIGALRDSPDGTAEFPLPVTKYNGLEFVARRCFREVFFPINSMWDFQRCRAYFIPEWLSKAELEERVGTAGWSREFVDDVLKNEGVAAFPEYIRVNGPMNIAERGPYYYKGLYQVVYCHAMLVNDEGVPGRYLDIIHLNSNHTAKPRELLDYQHGKYPGHLFTREAFSSRLIDTRGLAEIAGSWQGQFKIHTDGFSNNAMMGSLPPLVSESSRGMGDLFIAPLVKLEMRRGDNLKWLEPPQLSQSVPEMLGQLREMVNDYHGRASANGDSERVNQHRQFKVAWWLWNMREVWIQAIQCIQQFADDEVLQRVTNSRGEGLIAARDEIQGEFDLQVVFDPQDFSPEYLAQIAGIVKDLMLGMDRNKTIDPSPVVASIFMRLAPDMADAALRSEDEANADEITDELKCYQQIRSGTEPELPEDGSLNYQRRFEFYQQVQQMNPDIFADMAPDKRNILASRIQRLQALAQQFGANVAIGRQGGRTALGPDAAAGQPGGQMAMAGAMP